MRICHNYIDEILKQLTFLIVLVATNVSAQNFCATLPEYSIRDAQFNHIANRFIAENMSCIGTTDGIVIVFQTGDKEISLGILQLATKDSFRNSNGVTIINNVHVSLDLYTSMLEKLAVLTDNTVTIHNLYESLSAYANQNDVLIAQDDSQSQWTFEYSDGTFIPKIIEINTDCSTTQPCTFPVDTQIILKSDNGDKS